MKMSTTAKTKDEIIKEMLCQKAPWHNKKNVDSYITRDEQLEGKYGVHLDKYPTHLGEKDLTLERLWLWTFSFYQIVTYDEGNGYCRVIAIYSRFL